MVYISSWQEYQEAAEALYEKAPDKARYCIKWRASEGKLVLKITDDVTCLKYKTHSSLYLNRFETLNLTLMQRMQNRRPTQPTTEPIAPTGSGGVVPPTASAISAGGIQEAGTKKKKPKKKK